MSINKKYIVIGLCFLLVSGCDLIKKFGKKEEKKSKKKPVITGTVIAWVYNLPITLEELEEEIKAYNSTVPPDKPEQKITTRDQKINYLRNILIRRKLLYQEALDRGLDKLPEIQKQLEKTKETLLVAKLTEEITKDVNVTSQEIEDYYKRAKEQFKEPEERKIREIVVPTEAEAKEILIQLLQGADFADLAKKYSIVESAKKGGDLGFMTPEEAAKKRFKEFSEVAFSPALRVGHYSSIFKGPEGYYIIKIEAKRGGKQRSLSEMWDTIKSLLLIIKQRDALENFLRTLSQKAQPYIKIFEEKIK